MFKKIVVFVIFVTIAGSAYWLYQTARINPTYQGLPTVPCIDATQPIRQSYSFHIAIFIKGEPYLLDKTIGHDFGKCLHTMYTNDASGTVYIQANDTNQYTLGQLFDVWHKTFTNTQIMEYQTDTTHHVRIFVNGKEVATERNTPLKPQDSIEVFYQ